MTTISRFGCDQLCSFSSVQQLERLREAGLVVRAEDRRAVRVDDAVADLRLDAGVGAGRVHVEAEEQRVVAVAGVGGDEVADLVAADVAAERREALLELVANRFFVAGGAVDGNQFEEGLEHAILAHRLAGPLMSPSSAGRRFKPYPGLHPPKRRHAKKEPAATLPASCRDYTSGALLALPCQHGCSGGSWLTNLGATTIDQSLTDEHNH